MKYYGNFNFDKKVKLFETFDTMLFTLVSTSDIVFYKMDFTSCLWVRTSIKNKSGRILCYRYNKPDIKVYFHWNRTIYI